MEIDEREITRGCSRVKGVADSERAMMVALGQQPVSFTFEADQFFSPCTRQVCLRHCAERRDDGLENTKC